MPVLAARPPLPLPRYNIVYIFHFLDDEGGGGNDLKHAINLKFGGNDTPLSTQVCTYSFIQLYSLLFYIIFSLVFLSTECLLAFQAVGVNIHKRE